MESAQSIQTHHTVEGSSSPRAPQSGKTVVIGIDGSENSRRAFQWYVENIYQPSDDCDLVHTYQISDVLKKTPYNAVHTFNKEAMLQEMETERKKVLTELEGYAQLLRDAKIRGTVKSIHADNPGEGLLQVAKDVNATMIITGSRGMGTLRRTVLGSTSDFVLHHSHVPVAVVR